MTPWVMQSPVPLLAPQNIVIFTALLGAVWGHLPDVRRCGDPSCNEPVSEGKTLINYNSASEHVLSFAMSRDVTVYGKSKVQGNALWDVKIDGKRGFVPAHLIKETRVLKRELTYTVPVAYAEVEEQAGAEAVTDPSMGNTSNTLLGNHDALAKDVPAMLKDDLGSEKITLEDLNQYQVNHSAVPDQTANADGSMTKEESEQETRSDSISPDSGVKSVAQEWGQKTESSTPVTEEVAMSETHKPYIVIDGTRFPVDESDVDSSKVSGASVVSTAGEAPPSPSAVSGIHPTLSPVKFYGLYSSASSQPNHLIVSETSHFDMNPLSQAASDSVKAEGDNSHNWHSAEEMLTENAVPANDDGTDIASGTDDAPFVASSMTNKHAAESANPAASETLYRLVSSSAVEATSRGQQFLGDPEILGKNQGDGIDGAPASSNSKENDERNAVGKENLTSDDDVSANRKMSNEKTNQVETNKDMEGGKILDEIEKDYDKISFLNTSETIENSEESNHTPLPGTTTEMPNDLTEAAVEAPPGIDLSDGESGYCSSLNGGQCDEISADSGSDGLYAERSVLMTVAEESEDNPYHDKSAEQVMQGSMVSDLWTNFYGALHDYGHLLHDYLQAAIDLLPENLRASLIDLEAKGLSPHAAILTTIVALTCFLVVTAYHIVKRGSQESSLLRHICLLEQKLFAITAERDVLKEELETSQQKAVACEEELATKDRILKPLEAECRDYKSRCSVLEETVVSLEQQLESATEVGFELNRLLSDFLTSQSRTAQLQAVLQDLQKRLDTQAETLGEMRAASDKKSAENEELQQSLNEATQKITVLTTSLEKVEMEASEVREQKDSLEGNNRQLHESVTDLESTKSNLLKEVEGLTSRMAELQQELENQSKTGQQLQEKLVLKDKEFQGLKEAVRELKCLQNGSPDEQCNTEEMDEKVKQLLDTALVRQQVLQSKQDNRLLKEEISTLERQLRESDDQLSNIREENSQLSVNYNQAVHDKTEAQTKLEVLSNYFKEKETRLQRELGIQEAMRQQKEDDASSAVRRMALSEQESALYKSQLTAMKQDVEETEQSYKNQISLQEKKAHENWLAARAAERRVEEMRQENAVLRQRLTLLEREKENWSRLQPDGILKPIPHRFDSPNGEVPSPPNQNYSAETTEFAGSERTATPADRPLVMPLMHPDFPPLPPFMLPPGLPFGDPLLPPPPPFPSLEPWRLPPPRGMPFPPEYERLRHLTPPRSRASPASTYSKDDGRHSPPLRELPERRPPSERFSPPYKDSGSRESRSSSPPLPLHFHDRPPPQRTSRFPPPPLRNPGPPRREYPPENRGNGRDSGSMTSTPRTAPFPPTTERRTDSATEV